MYLYAQTASNSVDWLDPHLETGLSFPTSLEQKRAFFESYSSSPAPSLHQSQQASGQAKWAEGRRAMGTHFLLPQDRLALFLLLRNFQL